MKSNLLHKVGFTEKTFVILSLVCLSGGIITPIMAQFKSPSFHTDSNTFDLLLFYGINLISAILLKPYIGTAIDALKKEKFIALLLCVTFLSSFWSDVPLLTLRKTIGLFGTALFGFYFGIRYNFREQLNLLAIFFSSSYSRALLLDLQPHIMVSVCRLQLSKIMGALSAGFTKAHGEEFSTTKICSVQSWFSVHWCFY